MPRTYSLYEAKAKFSEVIRTVLAGRRVVITYRGREVAEISPIREPRLALSDRIRRLEEAGEVCGGQTPRRDLKPVARRPGALRRFLETRD